MFRYLAERRKFTIYQSIVLYRKFSADYIFNGHELLPHHVLITDDKGVVMDVVAEQQAGEDVEKLNGILTPGFVNCHCHLELSHMKGHIPKHTGLVDFVLKVVNERHYEEREILNAVERAENEMLQNGIVAVGDICNNILPIAQKAKGNLQYHNFIEASGFLPSVAETRFQRATDIYHAHSITLPHNSIVPHAPYSVSPQLFAMLNDLPGNHLLTIHNQEVAAENELFEKGMGDFLRMYDTMGIDIAGFTPSGKSSLQSVLPYFEKEQSLILVHNVYTTEKDLEFIKNQKSKIKIAFCLCPNANLYISNTLPDVNMLMLHTSNIVLGTDSLASNDQLSILEEIKTLQRHFPNLQFTFLLKWATSNGATALHMDDSLGSFEKGKRPAVILIENVSNLHLTEASSLKRIL